LSDFGEILYAQSAAMPVLFLLSGPKMGFSFFALQGRHVAPINVKFGTGERTEGQTG